MSETPTLDRIRDVLSKVYAVELRDILTAAVSGAPHWRREAEELLAKIKSGGRRSYADGHSDRRADSVSVRSPSAWIPAHCGRVPFGRAMEENPRARPSDCSECKLHEFLGRQGGGFLRCAHIASTMWRVWPVYVPL